MKPRPRDHCIRALFARLNTTDPDATALIERDTGCSYTATIPRAILQHTLLTTAPK